MKNCKYQIKGTDKWYTYQELMSEYYKHNYKALDIVYSAAKPKQERITDRINVLAEKLEE